ncbi:MAG TPA: ATP-binding protein [Verrucomicrobiae bacterium]|nr:ATP-binding protein [Verrucomicrobiae bacterium]
MEREHCVVSYKVRKRLVRRSTLDDSTFTGCLKVQYLLTNAVKFVAPELAPRVQVWTEPARRENGDHKWVRIWVQDNGLGIAPKHQSRIFRMFERVHPVEKYGGTGIGLAIVQKAVERMGGRVGVQSSPGAGSKFWIELREPSG